MRQNKMIKVIITFFILGFSVLIFPVIAQNNSDTLVDEIIVKFKNVPIELQKKSITIRTGIPAIDSLNRLYNCISMKQLFSNQEFPGLDKNSSLAKIYSLRFKVKVPSKLLVSFYLSTGCLEHAEPVKIGNKQGSLAVIPNDQYFSRQWEFVNNGTFAYKGVVLAKLGADMKVTEAWDIKKGDSSIIVAILDSGCRLKHDEFKGRIWQNKNEIQGNGIDDDYNGYIDDYQGWNFVDSNNVPEDNNFHGTVMASLIAANPNNGVGFAGMDWQCKIMIVKISDSLGRARSDYLAKGIIYAVNNGAKVINISIGFKDTSYTTNLAIDYAFLKGVVIVCGTGNDNVESVDFPAKNKKTISVGSTDPDDRRSKLFFGTASGGSNYGKEIDVVAPGNYIAALSISPVDYNFLGGGTSGSTALVSGLCALLFAENPSLTPTQIHDIICSTADDQVGDPLEDTKGWDKYYGYGRVNAQKALTFVANNGVKFLSEEKRMSATDFKIIMLPKGQIAIRNNNENNLVDAIVKIYNLQGVDITKSFVLYKRAPLEILLQQEIKIEGVAIIRIKNHGYIFTKMITPMVKING
jgi:subtilisin family serine protease